MVQSANNLVQKRKKGDDMQKIAMTIMVYGLHLMLLGCCSLIAEDSRETNAAAPTIKENARTGQKEVMTAAQVQASVEDQATKIQTLVDELNTGLSSESLVQKMLEENMRLRDKVNNERTASGGGQYLGASIPLPYGSVTMGGPVVDLERPTEWANSAPETVEFIVEGRNRLQTIDNKMKRASNWLNKHTCGGFDWGANFSSMFRVDLLKEYLVNLGEGVIASAPMALLCSFSPTVCEVVKHLKLNLGFQLSAEKQTCQQMEAALTKGVSNELWQGRYRQCLADQKASGASADKANTECQKFLQGNVKDPSGASIPINVSESAAQASNSWLQSGYDWTSSALMKAGSAVDGGAQALLNSSNQGGAEGAAEAGLAQAMGGGAAQKVKDLVSGMPGGGLLQTAGGLFGNVQFTGSGGLEVGRKRFQLFKLQMDNRAGVVADKLVTSIRQLGGQIMSTAPNGQTIESAHKELSSWTYRTRGGDGGMMPWTDLQYGKGRSNLKTQGNEYRFDNTTIDKLAVLYMYATIESATDAGSDQERAFFEKKYHPIHLVNMLSRYELWLYMSVELEKIHKGLIDATSAQPSSSEEIKTKVDTALKQYDQAMADVVKAIDGLENEFLPLLPGINSYVLPRFETPKGGGAVGGAGGIPVPSELGQ